MRICVAGRSELQQRLILKVNVFIDKNKLIHRPPQSRTQIAFCVTGGEGIGIISARMPLIAIERYVRSQFIQSLCVCRPFSQVKVHECNNMPHGTTPKSSGQSGSSPQFSVSGELFSAGGSVPDYFWLNDLFTLERMPAYAGLYGRDLQLQ